MEKKWISGFILQSRSFDQDGRHYLSFSGVGEKGPFELLFTKERPLYFIETAAAKKHEAMLKGLATVKDLPLKTLQFQPVSVLYFPTQRALYDSLDVLNKLGVRVYESDVKSQDRFLMERFINAEILYTEGAKDREDPEIKPGRYRPDFVICSLDIETGQKGELYSIGLVTRKGARQESWVLMVDETGEYKNEVSEHYQLMFFPSEQSLMQSFLSIWKQINPDLILGWHVIGFDFKFLKKVAERHRVKLSLGRNQEEMHLYESKPGKWGGQIAGRVILDGPPTLRGCFYKFSNFKLDTVARELLGIGKDISAETSKGKVEEIERRFRSDKKALAYYNFLDCELVLKIFDHLQLIDLMVKRSTISGLMIENTGVSTLAFDHCYLPKLHREGLIAPSRMDREFTESSGGGYVMEPLLGMHEHVAVFDFKSLYPSVIRTFNIDPLSRAMAEKTENKAEKVMTPEGYEFSRTHSLLPKMIEELLQLREKAKLEKDQALSQSIKILMNSFYGVMGSPHCRFYHADLPQGITTTGQWILKTAISYFERAGYQVIYGDTDSVFVRLKNEDYGNYHKRSAELAKEFNSFLTGEIRKKFSLTSHLELQFEKLFRKIYMPPMRGGLGAAKKRYVGLIVEQGVEKLTFSGMEFVRTDWTIFAKNLQYKLYDFLFKDLSLKDLIKETLERLKQGQFDDELIYSKKLSKPARDYTKQIPVHIRAVLALPVEEQNEIREIEYYMTLRGPIPASLEPKDLDYAHYIEKQLKPIAADLLNLQGVRIEEILEGDQLSLF